MEKFESKTTLIFSNFSFCCLCRVIFSTDWKADKFIVWQNILKNLKFSYFTWRFQCLPWVGLNFTIISEKNRSRETKYPKHSLSIPYICVFLKFICCYFLKIIKCVVFSIEKAKKKRNFLKCFSEIEIFNSHIQS